MEQITSQEENSSLLSLFLKFLKNPLALFLSPAIVLFATLVFCIINDASLFYAFGLAELVFALILIFQNRKWFLFFFIVFRMSLDYFGEFLSIPITKNIHITLSQGIGLEIAFFGLLLMLAWPTILRSLRFILPLLMIFVWGVISLTFSVDPTETVRELLRIADIIIVFMIAFTFIQNEEDFKGLCLAIFISSIAPILTGAYQLLTHTGAQYESFDAQRIYGTFSHPNVFSLYLFTLIVVTILYFLVFNRKNTERTLTLITLGLVYSGMLIATYARVAFVALFVFCFILAALRFRKALAVVILAPILLYISIPSIQERVSEAFRSNPDSSTEWRIALWKDTINKTFYDNKEMLGNGMNTFPVVSENFRGIALGSNDPHNDFVKFFVEGGFVGLFLYCLFVIWIAFLLFRRFQSHTPTTTSSTVFLILFTLFATLQTAALSDNVFKNTPVQWIFWILLGASLQVFGHKKEARNTLYP